MVTNRSPRFWPRSTTSAFLVLNVIALGCTGAPDATPSSSRSPDPPSASPSTAASPSLSPSIAATAEPTSSQPVTASPTSAPPASAPPAEAFEIDWHQRTAGFGPLGEVVDSAVVDDRIVVIGSRYVESTDEEVPAIWWEDEDLVWRLAEIPAIAGEEPWLSDIVSGGPGLVVVGSEFDDDFGRRGILWLSSDGSTWESVDVPELRKFMQPEAVGVADDGLILLAYEGEAGGTTVALVSADGRSWHRSEQAATQTLAAGSDLLVGAGTELTAFERRIDPEGCDGMTGGICQVGPTRVWRASGADAWQIVGELPQSGDAMIGAAAIGPKGWFAAVDGGSAWFSADGRDWQRALSAPLQLHVVFGVKPGFVGVGGFGPQGGCASDGPGYALTWVSSDGREWQLVDALQDAFIETLRRRADTLIGIGKIQTLGPGAGTVWTAKLPEEGAVALAPSPIPLPTAAVCPP